jgi:Protein kinase domain
MLHSEKIELEIYRFIKGSGMSRSVTIGALSAKVNPNADFEILVERLVDLNSHNRIALFKFGGATRVPYAKYVAIEGITTFFYQGSFAVEIAPQGRKYFEGLERQEKSEQAKPAGSRDFRDPYPKTLEDAWSEMDYWVTRQGEGQPGSAWEEGVRGRMEHLRSLDIRFRESRQSAKLAEAAPIRKQKSIFKTAFASYKVTGQLGQGKTGIVHEVEDEDGRILALKVLDPKFEGTRIKRFRNEIAFCLRNIHRNIITVLEYGVSSIEPTSPFYVMPIYRKTLRTLMDEGIPADDVLPAFIQMLDGVEAAHLDSVIHRDLKPENILFDVENKTLVIADFGIASFKEMDLYTAVETNDGERLANFQYSAPEQRHRGRNVDHRTDIFALGLILNEMFTSQVPQGTGYKLISAVSPHYAYLDKVVEEMIQQEVAKRPDSVATVRKGLAHG